MSNNRFVKLQLECLEDRLLLSGTLQWPVTLPQISLMSTYGQFVSSPQGMVLHSGIDILIPTNLVTPVRPIQTGGGTRVFGVGVPPLVLQPYRFLSVRDTANGFNYTHVAPGINPNNRQGWQPNDVVTNGSILGGVETGLTLTGAIAFPRHLHLDYTDIVADPRFVIGGVPTILRPMDDPLAFLTPMNDLVAPFVSNDIHFRIAQDDTQQLNQILPQTPQNVGQALEGIITSHKYFQEVAGGRLLIGAKARMVAAGLNARSVVSNTGDMDIIASMFDQTAAGGRLLNIRRNWFRIAGESFGKDTGWISSFMFAGEFLGANQNMNQFYNSDLTRVVYEHDRQSFSNGPVLPGPGSQTAFWYIMTNTDGNNIVELGDRGRFWNSNVSIGNAWNAGNGADATSNATSEFPDDFYTISVSAEDESLNVSLPKSRKVLLVNWERTLQTSADSYDVGNTIRVTAGNQYRSNQDVALHLVPASATASTPPITSVLNVANLEALATTNAAGQLPMTAFINPAAAGRYFVIADYNGDGVYTPQLDAFKIIEVRRSTQTQLNVAPNPSTVGQYVTLTATVTGVGPGAAVPTGTVYFEHISGGPLLGSAPIVNGVATLRLNTLPAGNHSLRAFHTGSDAFNGSQSFGGGNHTVNAPNPARRPAQSSLTPVPGASTFGDPVTLTATVGADDGNPGTPIGTVSFYDGGDYIGDATLVSGTASLIVSNLSVGSHNLIVDYNGDDDFNFVAASSTFVTSQAQPTVSVTVNSGVYSGLPASAISTVTGVLAGVDDSPAESLEGVTPTLTYYYGSLPIGTPLLEAPNEAGTYTVVASYAGSDNYLSADSEPQTFVISKATPILAITTGDGTANGTPFDATVEVAGVVVDFDDLLYWELEGVTPTLTYFDATNTLLSGAPADPGTYTVVANFAGSANYESAGIGPVTFTINPVVNEFVSIVPSSQTTNEDIPLVFSSSNSNTISVAVPPGEGVGVGDIIVQVTITATNGTLTLNGTSGLGFSFSDSEGVGTGTGTADIAMTLRGSINDINIALDGLKFAPTAEFHGNAVVQIITNDLFMSGWTGALIDTKDVTITVNSVNDAPIGADIIITIAQNSVYTFSMADFGFADLVESPANYFADLIITSLPTVGTLLLSGSPVAVNPGFPAYAVAYMTYTPPAGQTGSPFASFKFKVRDDGGTANGGLDTSNSEYTLTFWVV